MRMRLHMDTGSQVDIECTEWHTERNMLGSITKLEWTSKDGVYPRLSYVDAGHIVAITRESE